MPGSERKKKGGERKDKKNARMREDVQRRRENEGEAGPESDQPDIQSHKPGSRGDRNMDPSNKVGT
jgi:hypothetical protein